MGFSGTKHNPLVIILILLIIVTSCKKDEVVDKLFDSQFNQFTDSRDGHIYNLIKIGTQTWMAENLAYLPQVYSPVQYSSTSERYYVYDYDGTSTDEAINSPFYKSYGVLYNWIAANHSCPSGWHLPSDLEWDSLTSYMVSKSGGKVNPDSLAFSLMAPFNWKDYFSKDSINNNNTGRNSSLFSALPGGNLYSDGTFDSEGNSAFWWSSYSKSSNDATSYVLTYNIQTFLIYDFDIERGFSVRCVKD